MSQQAVRKVYGTQKNMCPASLPLICLDSATVRRVHMRGQTKGMSQVLQQVTEQVKRKRANS
eukprot:1066617-Amphidinium_carterae.1